MHKNVWCSRGEVSWAKRLASALRRASRTSCCLGDIRVLGTHVVELARVDPHAPVCQSMDLRALAVILVLGEEGAPAEALDHLARVARHPVGVGGRRLPQDRRRQPCTRALHARPLGPAAEGWQGDEGLFDAAACGSWGERAAAGGADLPRIFSWVAKGAAG